MMRCISWKAAALQRALRPRARSQYLVALAKVVLRPFSSHCAFAAFQWISWMVGDFLGMIIERWLGISLGFLG